jgi:hypothetical protein
MIIQAVDREESRFAPHIAHARAHSAPLRPREADRAAPARMSDAELLVTIGRDLAAVYAEVLHQPLPKRLKILIEHIEANNHG